MKWFQRQWEQFKAKSFWGKFWDVLFVVIIILLIIPDGRLMVQRGLMKTGITGSTSSNTLEALDTAAMNWQLRNMDGQIITFGKLSERTIFLNHWATWCGPCKAEMPSIVSLMEATGNKAHFILLTSDDLPRVESYLKTNNWDLPVYFPVSPIPAQLNATSLPTTLVIDSRGNIIHRSEGMRDWGSKKARRLVLGKLP